MPEPTTSLPAPYRRNRVVRAVLPLARRVRSLLRPGPPLTAYDPLCLLVRDEHPVPRASVPAIDTHGHIGRWLTADGGWMEPDVGRLIATMDQLNVTAMVNLDGRWDDELEANLDRYDRAHPDRFLTFCHVDWRLLQSDGPDALVASLERSARAGARGLKVWRDLGLDVRVGGQLLMPDDARLAPVWEAAGALGLPVLVHVGNPLAFFLPTDRHNERLEEILRHPSVSERRHGPAHFHRLVDALEAVVAAHPRTTFIGAHVGCCAEDLGRVSAMLDRYPNYWIDLAARAELGRQPRAAARLVADHADRVLFGADIFPIDPAEYACHFRILETDDEYFSYSADREVPAPTGRWAVSGLALPTDVLEQVYAGNARRLFGLGPLV